MLTEPQRDQLKQALRPMQIIIGALAAGILVFMGIMLVVTPQWKEGGPDLPLLYVYIALGFAVVAFFAWLMVPRLISGRMRQAIADGDTAGFYSSTPMSAEAGDVRYFVIMYQIRLIIGSALLEGAAFFNVIAYFLEQQTISLGVAGLLVLILITQIPTFGRLESWAEDDLATIKQLRAMGSQHGR